jgi:hypothetical protein
MMPHMQRPLHTVLSTAQTKQRTCWDQYDRRPELTMDKKNYLFAEVCLELQGNLLLSKHRCWHGLFTLCQLRYVNKQTYWRQILLAMVRMRL